MNTEPFAEFVIRLKGSSPATDRFALTWSARAPMSRNRTAGACDVRLNQATFLALESDATAYGNALRDVLFADMELLKSFGAVRAQTREQDPPLRLRLSLVATDPILNTLRWELLSDPEGELPLALNEKILLSRDADSPNSIPAAAASRRKLSTLIVIANPHNHGMYRLAPIDGAGEEERVRAALGAGVQVRVLRRGAAKSEGPPTFERLLAALRERAPTILYLVCHGSAVGEDYGLWLEDEAGNAARVTGQDFAGAVAGLQRRPLVTVLAACDSSLPTNSALMALGPALAVAGVGAVIAMQGKIAMSTASRMLPRLFAELRRHGEVDRALVAARSDVRGTRDWWMPALYLRIDDGRIWSEVAPAAPLTRWQVRAFAVVALLMLVAIGALLGLQLAPHFAEPEPMTGGFRVAVAQFGRLDLNGRSELVPEGRDLAASVYAQIVAEVQQLEQRTGLDLEVNQPEQTGWVADEVAALRLAEQLRADLLIYGSLSPDGRSFTPEFVLTERLLGEAPELTGPFDFGSSVSSRLDVAKNPRALAELTEELNVRASALTRFIVGLAYYAFDERTEALAQFTAANQLWLDPKGREVLLLFLGNTTGRLRRYDEAERYYEEALALNPEFARAEIGRAEVLFQRSIGDSATACTAEGIDREGLEAAEAGFTRAAATADQAPAADIPAKVAFGRARVFQCLALATGDGDYLRQAQAAYQTVIDEFEAGNQRLKGRAAQAYANRGRLILSFQGNTGSNSELRTALAQYVQASELAETDEARAVYLGSQAHIHILLGECDEADRRLKEADDAYALFTEAGQRYEPFETWRAELTGYRENCVAQ